MVFQVVGESQEQLPTVDVEVSEPTAATGRFQVVDETPREEAAIIPGLARSFLGQGVALGFGDEIEAFARSRVSGRSFDEELADVRAELSQFQEENPVLSTGAEIAGALVLPGGAAARGATLGARALRAAGVGGTTGAIAGAGTAEGGLPERLEGAATGAALGAATGAVAAPVVEGVVRGGQALAGAAERAGAPIRGAVRPEAEAARRVARARQQDVALGTRGVTEQEFRAAQAAGLPVTNIELGGDVTRAVARSAANQSAEGRALLDRVINDRFEGQGQRIEDTINALFPGREDSFTRRASLQVAARRANRPAYERAYQEGDRAIRSPTLETLLSSPIVESAVARAATRGRDVAVAEGFGAFNPRIRTTPDGRVIFERSSQGIPIFPDLRLWDLAKRELDDAANAARRQGRNQEAATIGQLAEQLRDELDVLVPSYQRARGTAQSFFRAGDALEAGQNFARQSRFGIPEARAALNRMSQPEQELFAEGFADELVTRLNQARDRRNVVQQIYGSRDARDRIRLALGNQRADVLEAQLRTEQVMDLARSAVQGNSTTARQLVELGLVGGGAGALTGFDPTSMVASALLWRGGRRLRDRASERVARRVAELLVSDDPQAVNRAVQQIARTPNLLSGLRRFDAALARAGAQQAAQIANQAEESEMQ